MDQDMSEPDDTIAFRIPRTVALRTDRFSDGSSIIRSTSRLRANSASDAALPRNGRRAYFRETGIDQPMYGSNRLPPRGASQLELRNPPLQKTSRSFGV